MTVETRKSEVKNYFNDWKSKNRFYERDVLKVTEKWRQIKTPMNRSGNSVDVFNHENSEQFITYSFNEWNESNSLTNNKSYWTDEITNLISRDRDDFDSEDEYESRLNGCLEISNKYN